MRKHFQRLAVVLTLSALSAFASGTVLANPESGHAYETCLTVQALELERTGMEIDAVMAKAERACRDAKTGLTNASASEVRQKTRLAVMQQRSNARNTLRRG
jgi:hypothetical protein